MINQNIIAQIHQVTLKTRFLRQLLQKLDQIEIRILLPDRVEQLNQLVYAMRFHTNIIQ
jgi:hypothetical protein